MSGYWGVMPAAGRGKRFGGDTPKQYVRVADGLVIEHSLEALLRNGKLQRIVVSLADGDELWPRVRYSRDPRIVRCRGGESRGRSVMAALEALRGQAAPDDWVVVHDAVRPCLADRELSGLIEAVKGDDVGGLLVAPVNDALKQLSDRFDPPVVGRTLDRGDTMRALTPQMFRFGLLFAALGAALEKNTRIDDEAQAMEIAGHRVRAVTGEDCNLKLTHFCELPLVESWLKLNRLPRTG